MANVGSSRAGQVAGKVALPVALTAGAIGVANAVGDGDAAEVGSTAGGLVGGMGGFWGGSAAGAALGTMVFPGVGTAVGGMAGGIAGSLAGTAAGSWVGERLGAGWEWAFGDDESPAAAPSQQAAGSGSGILGSSGSFTQQVREIQLAEPAQNILPPPLLSNSVSASDERQSHSQTANSTVINRSAVIPPILAMLAAAMPVSAAVAADTHVAPGASTSIENHTQRDALTQVFSSALLGQSAVIDVSADAGAPGVSGAPGLPGASGSAVASVGVESLSQQVSQVQATSESISDRLTIPPPQLAVPADAGAPGRPGESGAASAGGILGSSQSFSKEVLEAATVHRDAIIALDERLANPPSLLAAPSEVAGSITQTNQTDSRVISPTFDIKIEASGDADRDRELLDRLMERLRSELMPMLGAGTSGLDVRLGASLTDRSD